MKLFTSTLILLAGLIGAGIATGREIYQYFFSVGIYSIIFLVVFTFIFIFFLNKLKKIKKIYKINSLDKLNVLLFKKENNIFSYLFYFSLFIICVAMVSASRELFENNFYSFIVALAITLFSSFVCFRGINTLKKFTFSFSCILLLLLLINCFSSFSLPTQTVISYEFSIMSIIMPLLFFAGNIMLVIDLVIMDKKLINTKHISIVLPILFSVLILLIIFSLQKLANLADLSLPLYTLAGKFSDAFVGLYLIALLLAIVSTLCVVQHSIAVKYKHIKYSSIMLSVAIFSCSFFDFTLIVQFAYSFIGIVGVGYILGIFCVNTKK